jgi:hypothetical protein
LSGALDANAPSSSADALPDTSIAPAPSPTQDGSTAPSSRAPSDTPPSQGERTQTEREGLLAAVKSVLQPKDGADTEPGDKPSPGEAPDAGAETVPGGKPDGGETPPAEPSPAELADPTEAELRRYKPETRRRIERLLAQRDEFRRHLDTVQPELEQHRTLRGYLDQHQLAPDDVNTLLGVGAALRRGDYQGFLTGVTPYVMAAQEALGLRIPRDLQAQVDEGRLTEENASELARTRHRVAHAEEQMQAVQQRRTQDQQNQAVLAVRGAVQTWEDNLRKRDPDYPLKSDAVRRYSQALLAEKGPPRTPDEAVALAQAAYEEVGRTFARARPAPQATRAAPSGVQGATGVSPEIRTMKDAAYAALANMRRAS